MADTAARLTDEPAAGTGAPVRALRDPTGWPDGDLVGALLTVFLRVYGWYRHQARDKDTPRVWKFAQCNPHYHVLMPDSVYVTGDHGTPTFVPPPPPTDDDMQKMSRVVGVGGAPIDAQRVVRLL